MIIRNENGKLVIINKNTFINDTLYYKQIYNIKYKVYEKYKNHLNCENDYDIDKCLFGNHTKFLVDKNISSISSNK
jgi:hypothetical protein